MVSSFPCFIDFLLDLLLALHLQSALPDFSIIGDIRGTLDSAGILEKFGFDVESRMSELRSLFEEILTGLICSSSDELKLNQGSNIMQVLAGKEDGHTQ